MATPYSLDLRERIMNEYEYLPDLLFFILRKFSRFTLLCGDSDNLDKI